MCACRWDDAWYYLAREMQLDSIPPADAAKRVGGGQWVLVDIRPRHKYEQSHAEGAVNVEYYKRVRAVLRCGVHRSRKMLPEAQA